MSLTLIVLLVPVAILACVDIGLISIVKWLVRR